MSVHKLGIKDIVFMNLVGIISLKQIPNVAPYGASSIMLWLVVALCFFIPLGLICGELATTYSKDGGMFVWIKEAFGKKLAYIATTSYLFSCVVFFPTMCLFGFIALMPVLKQFINITDEPLFRSLGSIFCFCFLTFLNIRGIKYTKIVNAISVYLGVVIPMVILFFVSIVWIFNMNMQTDYSNIQKYIPDFSDFDNIVFTSSMVFAFAGIEISSMVASKAKNPKKDFSVAIFISSALIVGIYILGTVLLNVIYPAEKISILSGFATAIASASEILGLKYIPEIFEIGLFIGVMGQINSWLIGPIYMLNTALADLGQNAVPLHPKYKTPHKALIIQAILVSSLCVLYFFADDIDKIYWFLTSFTSVCYFIPYIFVFLAFIKLRATSTVLLNNFFIPTNFLAYFIACLGLFSILCSVSLSFIPPHGFYEENFFNKLMYFSKSFFGVMFMLTVALLSFKLFNKKH